MPTDDLKAFRLIDGDDGRRHLVDCGGVRYLSECGSDCWELAIASGNWPAIRAFAEAVLATPDPGRS